MNQIDPLLFLLILLVTFSVFVFLTWYFYHNAKTKERLILLEKNADLSLLLKKEQQFNFPWLKVGILVTGLGIAFGIQAILVSLSITGQQPLYLFVLFVCGGISLIVANYVDKKKG